MPTPNWKQYKNVKARIYVLGVDANKREFDALDLDLGMAFSIEVNDKIDFFQIKKGKTYQIEVKVFKAGITPELENKLIEMSKHEIDLLEIIKVMKSSASQTLFRFELISLKPH